MLKLYSRAFGDLMLLGKKSTYGIDSVMAKSYLLNFEHLILNIELNSLIWHHFD